MLVKFCRPEHNLREGCYTVRLGTFEYFRNMNGVSPLGDATEGLDVTSILHMDAATASHEAQSALVAIRNRGTLINCQQTLVTPNCFMFCCSELPDEPNQNFGTMRFAAEYSSHYTITSPNRFAARINNLLLTRDIRPVLSHEGLAQLDKMSLQELHEVQIAAVWGRVHYVKEKCSVIDAGQLARYAPQVPDVFRPIFVKPVSFQDDEEFRFVFWIFHPNHGILAVRRDPLDIDLRGLD